MPDKSATLAGPRGVGATTDGGQRTFIRVPVVLYGYLLSGFRLSRSRCEVVGRVRVINVGTL